MSLSDDKNKSRITDKKRLHIPVTITIDDVHDVINDRINEIQGYLNELPMHSHDHSRVKTDLLQKINEDKYILNLLYEKIHQNTREENKEKIKDIPEPVGKFVTENSDGIQMEDGMYYHYSDVCVLIKQYHKKMKREDS